MRLKKNPVWVFYLWLLGRGLKRGTWCIIEPTGIVEFLTIKLRVGVTFSSFSNWDKCVCQCLYGILFVSAHLLLTVYFKFNQQIEDRLLPECVMLKTRCMNLYSIWLGIGIMQNTWWLGIMDASHSPWSTISYNCLKFFQYSARQCPDIIDFPIVVIVFS